MENTKQTTNNTTVNYHIDEETKHLIRWILIPTAIAVVFGILVSSIWSLQITRQQVTDLTSQVKELRTKNSQLETALETAQLQNADLQNDLANTTAELETRNEEIAVYEETMDEISDITEDINGYIVNIKAILKEAEE